MWISWGREVPPEEKEVQQPRACQCKGQKRSPYGRSVLSKETCKVEARDAKGSGCTPNLAFTCTEIISLWRLGGWRVM